MSEFFTLQVLLEGIPKYCFFMDFKKYLIDSFAYRAGGVKIAHPVREVFYLVFFNKFYKVSIE